jgi:hypothetical protein
MFYNVSLFNDSNNSDFYGWKSNGQNNPSLEEWKSKSVITLKCIKQRE